MFSTSGFSASAPGSLMLLGEYAVLHGKHALTCAVNKRMTVTLVPRTDTQIEIVSSSLGQMTTDLSHLTVAAPFQFVLATLKKYQKQLKSGCKITIESQFSDKVGLGSSAAVTVATLAVLTEWLAIPLSETDMIRQARAIIRHVQGLGSGADVAACVLGGMVAYKMQPLLAEKLAFQHTLTAIYSGYKTPTVEAVKKVKEVFVAYPKVVKQLFQSIDACVLQGIQAIRDQHWLQLGTIMNIQQGLMEALGVSTPLLGGIVNELREQPAMLGAKISGSGLGDCVVGLGPISEHFLTQFSDQGVKQIPIEISLQGVIREKI